MAEYPKYDPRYGWDESYQELKDLGGYLYELDRLAGVDPRGEFRAITQAAEPLRAAQAREVAGEQYPPGAQIGEGMGWVLNEQKEPFYIHPEAYHGNIPARALTPEELAYWMQVRKQPQPIPKLIQAKPRGKGIVKRKPIDVTTDKGITTVQAEARGPLPEAGKAVLPTEKPSPKVSFWKDLLKKMFIPGQTPTGIPWIFPTIWALAGTPEAARPMAMWLQLRQGVAKKEQAKLDMLNASYLRKLEHMQHYGDDLSLEERKQYSKLDPSLMKKKKYKKKERWYWNPEGKWIEEANLPDDPAVLSWGAPVERDIEYVDWAVRPRAEARTDVQEKKQEQERRRTISWMLKQDKEAGIDVTKPEYRRRAYQFVKLGTWPDLKVFESNGYLIKYDPATGKVLEHKLKSATPEARAGFELKMTALRTRMQLQTKFEFNEERLKKDPQYKRKSYWDEIQEVARTYASTTLGEARREYAEALKLDPMTDPTLDEKTVEMQRTSAKKVLDNVYKEMMDYCTWLYNHYKEKYGYEGPYISPLEVFRGTATEPGKEKQKPTREDKTRTSINKYMGSPTP